MKVGLDSNASQALRRAGRHPAQAGARWRRRLQPRCRYVRDGMIPALVTELAAMEPIEKLFIVMAVIGLLGLVSTVVYLLAR